MMNPAIDYKKFKGYAIVNRSEKEVVIIIDNESAFPKEFIMKPNQVFYAHVGDIVELQMAVASTASSGAKSAETLTFAYDEI